MFRERRVNGRGGRVGMAVLVTLGVLIGCLPRMTRSVSFLDENLPYRADPNNKDVVIYRNPAVKIASYTKFLVEPVKIFSNESVTLKKDEEAALAETFRADLIDVLGNGYEVVDQPGPQVLRVRIAIQDIQPAHAHFNGEGAIVLRLDTLLARVAMELSCVDALSGERVAGLIHTLKAKEYFEDDKRTRLLNVRNAFHIWVTSLRVRFDAARTADAGFDGLDPAEYRRLRFEEGE